MSNWLKQNKYTINLLAILILLPLYWGFVLPKYLNLRSTVKQQEAEITTYEQQNAVKSNQRQVSADYIFSGRLIDELNTIVTQRNLKIVQYTPLITKSDKFGALYTADMIISGDFLQMINLVRYIETNFKQCRIISVGYFAVSVDYNGSKHLQCKIVIQQIIKIV